MKRFLKKSGLETAERVGQILVRHENLEAIYNLRQRDRAVAFPLVERLCIIYVHNEIFFLALKMDLGLRSVSTHVGIVGQVSGLCFFKIIPAGIGPDRGFTKAGRSKLLTDQNINCASLQVLVGLVKR